MRQHGLPFAAFSLLQPGMLRDVGESGLDMAKLVKRGGMSGPLLIGAAEHRGRNLWDLRAVSK